MDATNCDPRLVMLAGVLVAKLVNGLYSFFVPKVRTGMFVYIADISVVVTVVSVNCSTRASCRGYSGLLVAKVCRW